ncbi:MAG: branched-chain amino acid ABC transporter permease [Betaproteobacteria bacterium]|nr:branched-chain amino acid ABC transporter permease [Betaproteobacteria bacterium]
MTRRGLVLQLAILAAGVAAPFVFPGHTVQLAVLWMMILFAMTWDTVGGQMGYNSLGNIVFFGFGMYVCAVTQIGMVYDVAKYTAATGAIKVDLTNREYFDGLALGVVFAALAATAVAAILSRILFGLRGPYFAIGTLGAAIAAAELTASWSYVGAGSGIAMPVFPGGPGERERFFYFTFLAATVLCFLFLRWLYGTRFGLAINAIRDDEDKAEALGLHTVRYKTIAWCTSAFFLGIAGALFGNMNGFIEPLEVAYPTLTFGIFMVAMTLLGGKGTLWGPILGAVLFYAIQQVTWTYLLGWQYIALGALIIVNVVYFQQGIMGWLKDRKPKWFGVRVEAAAGDDGRGGS